MKEKIWSYSKHLRFTFCLCLLLMIGHPFLASALPPENPNTRTWVTNGFVGTIVSVGHTTYIGGSFTKIGPKTGSGVPLSAATGAPLPGYAMVNGLVHKAIPDGSGGWFIGGNFTAVGGVARNKIARIQPDGTLDASWNPDVGGTGNWYVTALALDGGILYVGGYFSSVGGESRNNLAAIDTATGLPTPWNPGVDGSVYAIAAGSGKVFVGGGFTTIGGQARSNFASSIPPRERPLFGT